MIGRVAAAFVVVAVSSLFALESKSTCLVSLLHVSLHLILYFGDKILFSFSYFHLERKSIW